jgi:uncharacterized protein YndB with AHSA1/START domain
MPDILHRLPIAETTAGVFSAISTPAGLNEWWTLDCDGIARRGETYRFGFGAGFEDWRGEVTRLEENRGIEWTMTHADRDWTGTVVALCLVPDGDRTVVEFSHRGWQEANDHFRTTSCCWASYLRILRRYLEFGERVPYPVRLEV